MNGGKRKVWKKKGTAHELKVPHHQSNMVEAVLGWPRGTGTLVFIDDVTANGSIRINSKVYRAILTPQI